MGHFMNGGTTNWSHDDDNKVDKNV